MSLVGDLGRTRWLVTWEDDRGRQEASATSALSAWRTVEAMTPVAKPGTVVAWEIRPRARRIKVRPQ